MTNLPPAPDKNRNGILRWEAAGVIFIVIAGSLFHFFYQWFGPSPLLAAVFPVNESVWEHFKLGYWSLVLFSIVQSLTMRWRVVNFWAAKGIGALVLQAVIAFSFYAYTPLAGRSILAADIGSYILGTVLCQAVSFWILVKSRPSRNFNNMGIWLLLLHGLALVLFTFHPLRFPIFMDSRTGAYGIP
jgi:hypothetical protein